MEERGYRVTLAVKGETNGKIVMKGEAKVMVLPANPTEDAWPAPGHPEPMRPTGARRSLLVTSTACTPAIGL